MGWEEEATLGEEEEEGREEEEGEEEGGGACLAAAVGGATVADVRRTGERNSRRRQAVDGRGEGVGDATNLQVCWAKGAALASIERDGRREEGGGCMGVREKELGGELAMRSVP